MCNKTYSKMCKKRFIPKKNTLKNVQNAFNDWILKLYTHYPPYSREQYFFGSFPHGNDIYDTFNATQVSWYADEHGKVNVKDIYHLENIQDEYKTLQKKIPCLKNAILPHKKKGTYKDPWQSFYTNQTIVNIMQQVYDIDFKYFGYSKYII